MKYAKNKAKIKLLVCLDCKVYSRLKKYCQKKLTPMAWHINEMLDKQLPA
jgi:hypothetical protein